MKKTIILLAAIFLFNFSYSQNEKLKSLFIYNFTKYIKWSGDNGSGDFIIEVYKDKKMLKTLKTLLKNKKTGNRKIVIKNFTSKENLNNCNILFIPSEKSNIIASMSKILNNKATVIVSENKYGISKGAGINFIVKKKKIKFEIRKRNVEKKGIKVNSNLLKLGIKK